MAEPFSPPAETIDGPATQKAPSGRSKHVLLILGSVLLIYTLSYVVLRNRGIGQMEAYDNVGILYTDVESTFQRKDLTVHLLLAALFAPANELDCKFFGGEYPIRCILFDLG